MAGKAEDELVSRRARNPANRSHVAFVYLKHLCRIHESEPDAFEPLMLFDVA